MQRSTHLYIKFNHALSYGHQNHDVQIDLHWRVGSNCSTQFTNSLWQHLIKHDGLPNAERPQLAYEVFMIIVHAVDSKSEDNLNWILDIAVINSKHDPSFWQEARKLAIAEQKEDLFDYGCHLLSSFGVFAPTLGTIKEPKSIVRTSPKYRKHMNLFTLTYTRMRNSFYIVSRLFPHSSIFVKLSQFAKYLYFFAVTRNVN